MAATARRIEIKSLYKTQNADRVARREDYAHLEKRQLLVRTLFPTLQGEGPFAGTPCVFVRLAGCNLGNKEAFCQWCDTDFKLAEGRVMSFDDVIGEMWAAWTESVKRPQQPKLLVLTGGEPGLQPHSAAFVKHAIDYGWRVQVETNGTQASLPLALTDIEAHVTLVVSPKAGPKGYGALNVKLWAGRARYNVLKIIVDSEPAAPHHLDARALSLIEEWRKHCGPRSVYLSPMAIYLKEYKGEVSSAWQDGLIDRERTRRNYNYAFEQCLKHGLLLSIQQHLFAEAP